MVQIRQTERRIKVLELLRRQKTETEIADTLHFSRNTIVRDVKWLKENLAYDFTLITNEIMQKLHDRIDKMTNYELIAFFGKLYAPTHKMELKEEVKFKEEIRMDISVYSDDEKSILDKAARILDRKSKGKSNKIH